MASTVAPSLSQRVKRGVRVMLVREVAVRILTVAGGLAIAVLLGPSRYGVFAVGLALVPALVAISVGGLSASLLRRPEPPTEAELHALFTFQLVFSLLVAAVGILLGFFVLSSFGAGRSDGKAVSLALLALPISAFRAGSNAVLERELQYERVSVIDVAEQAALYSVAVLLAAFGAGIWSLPAGCVAGSVAATGAAVRLTGLLPRPTRRLDPLRSIWRFGALFQFTHFLSGARDFGVNALLLGLAGPATAGIWALAQRLLVPALVVMQTLTRVSYVAFSKVLVREEWERQAQSVLGVVAISFAGLLACIVGAAPALVHSILGERWTGVIRPVELAACGWIVLGPIAASVGGLVQARGDLRAPTIGLVIQVTVLWTAAAVFAPAHGASAVGLAWLVGLLLNAIVFFALSRRFLRLELRPLLGALAIAAGATAASRTVADAVPTLTGLVASVATALAVWLALSALLAGPDLRRLAGLAGLARSSTPFAPPARG